MRLWSLDLGPLSNSGLECHLQKTITVETKPQEDPQKTGIKIVRVSPDELFIASGDRNGNIRVHDARSYEEICKIEAHDAEVTSLKFAGDRYLASASRDRLVTRSIIIAHILYCSLLRCTCLTPTITSNS